MITSSGTTSARPLVRGFRVVVAGRELGDVTERLRDDGDLRGVGAGALGHVQRALVQLDRLDVRRTVLRPPSPQAPSTLQAFMYSSARW